MRRGARAGLALAVIVLGAACSGPMESDAGVAVDAAELDGGTPEDASAPVDAGRDAGADAGPIERDAGRRVDAGHDSGPPEADAGPPPACDLYDYAPLACGFDGDCGAGRTCRRAHLDTDTNLSTGPAECGPVGPILEHNYGSATLCFDDEDCHCGLFCRRGGECVRYCDPEGEPCPNDMSGHPQRCVEDALGVFYCSNV